MVLRRWSRRRQKQANDDGGGLQRSAAAALANEIRAYEAIQGTAEDVTRGAVFLMLLGAVAVVFIGRFDNQKAEAKEQAE